ncbi:preprotein translocase subunit YajC [Kribbella deserti]|uniref:Preprotein translocase subunit YajC n=1 Tax=Kribbella deserti TaxID=1926257 RepID=A0ABV6QH45_9ACTN
MLLTAVPMAESSSGGSGFTLLLPLILIIGMIWFMSRSQKKQKARQAETVAALKPGTRVITTSGQLGTVWDIDEEYVTLEVAPDVYTRFVKQAVGRVLPDEEPDDEPAVADTDATDTDVTDAPVKDSVEDSKLPPTHTEK